MDILYGPCRPMVEWLGPLYKDKDYGLLLNYYVVDQELVNRGGG